MDEKQLYSLVENASEYKVRSCLKSILSSWFVEEDEDETRKVNFNKELDSDTLEEVTTILHVHGFCPPEKE